MSDPAHPFFKHLGNPSPRSGSHAHRATAIEDANPAQLNSPHIGGTPLGGRSGRGEEWPAYTEKNVPELDGKPTPENLHLWGRYASWNSPQSRNSPRHRR